MPVDTSIYNAIQPVQQPQGPLDQYVKAMQVKQLMNQGEISDRALASDTAVRSAFSGLQPGQTIKDLLPAIYKADPKTGMALQAKLLEQEKTQGDIEKTKIDMHGAQVKQLRDMTAAIQFGSPYGEAQLGQLRETTAKLYGPQVAAQIPQSTSDPNFAQWQQQAVMTSDEFLQRGRPKYDVANLGGTSRVIQTNPNAPGAVTGDLAHTQSPDSIATDARSAATLAEQKRHNRVTEGDPQEIETTAQAIASGKLAPLSGFALARPAAQRIMARVVQINPDFDPTQFQTRQKAEKDFATGKQGNSVRSFNVALDHLDTLDQLSDALKNGNTQLFNKIGNTVAQQTGSSAPTNFESAKKIVSDEIVKAIVGSGGGVSDREEAAKTIAAASSPEQLKGVINTYKALMRGQINGLREQYKATTGKDDFDTKYLSESGRKAAHAPVAAPAAPAGKGGIKFLGFE